MLPIWTKSIMYSKSPRWRNARGFQVVKKEEVQETQFPAGCGDGGKCVPSGHLREAQNDPQSSTETSVGYGSSLHED